MSHDHARFKRIGTCNPPQGRVYREDHRIGVHWLVTQSTVTLDVPDFHHPSRTVVSHRQQHHCSPPPPPPPLLPPASSAAWRHCYSPPSPRVPAEEVLPGIKHVLQRATPGKRRLKQGKGEGNEKRVFKKQASFITKATACSVLHVIFRF